MSLYGTGMDALRGANGVTNTVFRRVMDSPQMREVMANPRPEDMVAVLMPLMIAHQRLTQTNAVGGFVLQVLQEIN